MTEAQARKVLHTILESAGQSPIQTDTIQDYFTNWPSGKELAKKPRTGERYRIVVQRFLAGLGPKARQPLAALTARDIERFRNDSMTQGKAPKTVAVEIKVVRTVLNVARRQGRILTNPAEAVELPKVAFQEGF